MALNSSKWLFKNYIIRFSIFFEHHPLVYPPSPNPNDMINEWANEITTQVYFASNKRTLGPFFGQWEFMMAFSLTI